MSSLLVIACGREKAAVWTQPGGITLGPQEGTSALGTSPLPGGFPAAMMDGSVIVLAPSIAGDALHGMINPADGR